MYQASDIILLKRLDDMSISAFTAVVEKLNPADLETLNTMRSQPKVWDSFAEDFKAQFKERLQVVIEDKENKMERKWE